MKAAKRNSKSDEKYLELEALNETKRSGSRRERTLPDAKSRLSDLSLEVSDGIARIQLARPEVRDAVKIVERYYADWEVCEEKLNNLPVSSEWLRHLFREETGMSIQQYQRSCQLWQAAMLLTCTSFCIYEIAEAVGIPETTYFGQLFRQRYGESPQTFRENTFWGRREKLSGRCTGDENT